MSNRSKIAKNTIFLYVRMLLTMGIALYTSRVVLRSLGAEDFGVYSVVAGVVASLGFFLNSLSGASSRFLTYALGEEQGTAGRYSPRMVFSTTLWMYLGVALLVLLLAESVGLYLIAEQLTIPAGREQAAFWTYQLAIVTAIIGIMSVPNTALIIAQEEMRVFAYVSIFESIGKLVVAHCIVYSTADRLVTYALLYALVQFSVTVIYVWYNRKTFPSITRGAMHFDVGLFKEMFSYSLWTLNGNVAVVGYTEGINILLNIFFGPLLNAARGVAVQVQNATAAFVQNFQLAIRPQIIKSYACKDFAYMHELVLRSSKLGFYLTLLLVFPLLLTHSAWLSLWLGEVPPYTSELLEVLLLVQLFHPLKTPLINAIHATGNIKRFQLYEASVLLMVVPVSYVLLRWGHISAVQVMWTYWGVECLAQGLRVYVVLPSIGLAFKCYFQQVILPLLWVSILLGGAMLLLHGRSIFSSHSLFTQLGVNALLLLGVVGVVMLLGLTQQERAFVVDKLRHKLSFH